MSDYWKECTMKLRWMVIVSLIALSACNGGNKTADRQLTCMLTSEIATSSYVGEVRIQYISEGEEMLTGEYSEVYSGLEKSENSINFSKYMDKQSLLEGISGVKVNLEVSDTGFSYKEIWDYQKVNIEEILEILPEQSNQMSEDRYSLKKIKEKYLLEGYSCDEKSVK